MVLLDIYQWCLNLPSKSIEKICDEEICVRNGLLRIALVQIEIPFTKGLMVDRANDGKSIFKWKDIQFSTEKILKILNNLKEKESGLNLVVFPEYSIPSSMLNDLITFSNENKIAIIGGSCICDNEKSSDFRKNICPIIIPNKERYYAKKKLLSKFEKDIVNSDKKGGYELHLEVQKEVISIQVLLCSDYLATAWGGNKLSDRPGIIIVPMFSNNIDDFYNLARLQLRAEPSKFVALCSAVGSMPLSATAKGGTSFFASTDPPKNPAAAVDDYEGVIVSSLNLLHPKIIEIKPAPIPSEGPGNPIQDVKRYKIQQDGSLEFKDNFFNEIGIVHPNILRINNQKLRIALYQIKNYPAIYKRLTENEVTSYAVFGDYDILCKTFEEENLFQKLKNTDFFDLVIGHQIFSISEIYRWEGHKVEYKEIGKKEIDTKTKKNINKLAENYNSLNLNKKQNFDRYFLCSKCNSGKDTNIKCFTFIQFPDYHNDFTLKQKIIDAFSDKKYIDKIKGIYYGDLKNTFPINWNWLIETEIEDFRELREIILLLQKLNKEFNKPNKESEIGVITRTYSVVETIHEKNYQLA